MKVVEIWDALRLVEGISATTAPRSEEGGATELEVHSLAYLACLLARWRDPDLDWGYEFHSTERAEPFAPTLAEALRSLRNNGMVLDHGLTLSVSPRGSDTVGRLAGQSAVVARDQYLGASLETPALLPIPLVMRALANEPTIATAATRQKLLDETAINVLEEYHKALVATAGEGASLLTLTELWLRYLLAVGTVAA